MSWIKISKKEMLIVGLVIIVRLVFLLIVLVKTGNGFNKFMLVGDSPWYYDLGINPGPFFSLHPPLSVHLSEEALLRTPGYPLFLYLIFTIFNKSLIAASVVQAFISGATAILIYRIPKMIKLPEFIGMASAITFAVEPMMAINSNQILTEALFLFFLILFFYLLVKWFVSGNSGNWFMFLLGLILAIDVLVRPVLQPFIPFLALAVGYYFYRYNKFSLGKVFVKMLFIILGAYVLLLPLAIKNKIGFGYFTVSSISTIHAYYGDATPYYAYRHNEPNKDLIIKNFAKEYNLPEDPYYPTNMAVYDKINRQIIFSEPFRYGIYHLSFLPTFFLSNGYRNIPRELGFSFSDPDQNYAFQRLLLGGRLHSLIDFFSRNFKYLIVFVVGFLVWFILTVLMLAGIWRFAWHEKDRDAWFFLALFTLTIAYFAITAGPEAYYKMRFPANPFIFILAFYGLYYWYLKFKHARQK